MKKLLYTLAGLSALALFASCNKEAERAASPEGEVVTATFTVAAPEGVATKAISDGTTATNLIVAVYDETGKYLDELSTNANATKTGAAPTWNVSMKVIKDMTYQFVFLAKKEADVNAGFCHFDAENAKISIDYSAVPANSDAADFFFVQDQFKVENSFSKTEEMHRPLAQVNFGASDLLEAGYSINTETMLTGVKLTGIYSEMNVLNEEEVTGTDGEVTFTQSARVPAESPKFVDGYDRIAMVYALVAKENQANVTATLNVTAKGAKNDDNHTITREIANVPLKRNYRTNILGNIFTNDFNFTVNTVPGFYTSDSNKLIGPSFASVADLNAYFATFTDNADNGDVNPEVVTLTDFGSSETSAATITLPKYNATPVRIRITAAYSGTLTLEYADADADKPATVELYAPNMPGATLTGTITSTHLTILEGSHIGTSTVSTSDTTLEIQEGATVSTVNILKGNALIAGTVDKVDVQSGATADGENPVQVFVAKEAAIQQIELNAKSDVVVEQPKDNIDVSTSDNKIVVTINVAGSSATAQNGGEIYVVANVATQVAASGEGSTVVVDTNNSDSSTPIAVDCLNNTEDSSAISVVEGKGDDVVINNFIAKVDGVPADSEKTISQILAEATAGQIVTIYKAGTYTLPDLKNITVEAAEGADVVFSHTGSGNICSVPDGATFKNVSFTFGNNNYHGWQHAGKIVMEGCTLNGKLFSYGDMEFKNCTFNQTIEEYHMWCYSGNLSYKDCVFEGNGKFLNIYNEDNTGMPWILTFDGCEFSSTVSNKAALNIKATCVNKALKYNVTIKDCTVNENFPEAGVKSSALVVIAPVVQVDDLAVNVASDITIDLDGTVYSVKNGKVCLGDDALVGPGVTQDVTSGTYKVVNAEGFNYVLSSSAILKPASKNVTIALENDIDLTDAAAHTAQNLSGASYVVTLDGQGHSVKGLKEELFTEAVNGAVINVKNITFDSVNINKSDDKYVAVIMGYADCNGGINVSNVTFKDITLVGAKHIGVVYGYGGGWDKQSDGPVFMDSTIEACEFDNCQLTTTEGSAGVVAGHVAGNAWTLLTLKNSTVKNCNVTCGESNKAGVLFGTIGVAGTQAYGKTGGTYVVDSFWYDNTVTANGDAVERSFGRVGSDGGKYYIDGVLVASKVKDEAEVVSGDIYEKRP